LLESCDQSIPNLHFLHVHQRKHRRAHNGKCHCSTCIEPQKIVRSQSSHQQGIISSIFFNQAITTEKQVERKEITPKQATSEIVRIDKEYYFFSFSFFLS